MKKKERIAALLAGISLIIMAVSAGYSYGYIFGELIAINTESSLESIKNIQSLFLSGIAGWAIIVLTDIFVSISLYLFFKDTNKTTSRLTTILRLIYTLILGIAVFKLASISTIFSSDQQFTEHSIDLINLKVDSFLDIWSFGLIIFGFHILGLAFLSKKKKQIPNYINILILIAGFSYIFLHGSQQLGLFNENVLSDIEMILSVPMATGELVFAFWLIIKGGK